MESIYETTVHRLIDMRVESPRLEARLLIGFVCGCAPDDVSADICLSEEQKQMLEGLLAQRSVHRPLDKILGHKDFYKYTFSVSDDVLSPRPDTEILVEEAVRLIKKDALKSVLDLGTGSGCILCSLLADCSALTGLGVDQSVLALETARKNSETLKVSERCSWLSANWFDSNFTDCVGQTFDLIVSNPPYIPTDDVKALDPEVAFFDPRQALDGGADGYDSYRRIAVLTNDLLGEGGYILLEAGFGQAGQIRRIFEAQGLKLIQILKDLSGIERCLIFQKSALTA